MALYSTIVIGILIRLNTERTCVHAKYTKKYKQNEHAICESVRKINHNSEINKGRDANQEPATIMPQSLVY